MKNIRHTEQTQLLEAAYEYFNALINAYTIEHLKEGVIITHYEGNDFKGTYLADMFDSLEIEGLIRQSHIRNHRKAILTTKGAELARTLMSFDKL